MEEENKKERRELSSTEAIAEYGLVQQMPDDIKQDAPQSYTPLIHNDVLIERQNKQKTMACHCTVDDMDPDSACGDDHCLSRLMYIECDHHCPVGIACKNRRFTKSEWKKLQIFKTENKGWGLRVEEPIRRGQFLIEYCGEVMDTRLFKKRIREYGETRHHYFMQISNEEIIDATLKGSISRFINHSCEPNCETQKWLVGGFICIGFFAIRDISIGEEVTFDYKFQRWGEKAQICYCGAPTCKGIIGGVQNNSKQNGGSSEGDENGDDDDDDDEDLESEENEQSNSEDATAKVTKREKKRRTRRARAALTLTFGDDSESRALVKICNETGTVSDVRKVEVLCRLLLRADTHTSRDNLARVLTHVEDEECLKRFVQCQGLHIIRMWLQGCNITSMSRLQKDLCEFLTRLPLSSREEIEKSSIEDTLQAIINGLDEPPTGVDTPPNDALLDNEGDQCVRDERLRVARLIRDMVLNWKSLVSVYRIPKSLASTSSDVTILNNVDVLKNPSTDRHLSSGASINEYASKPNSYSSLHGAGESMKRRAPDWLFSAHSKRKCTVDSTSPSLHGSQYQSAGGSGGGRSEKSRRVPSRDEQPHDEKKTNASALPSPVDPEDLSAYPLWAIAHDDNNTVYYYHIETLETSWDHPSKQSKAVEDSSSSETPTKRAMLPGNVALPDRENKIAELKAAAARSKSVADAAITITSKKAGLRSSERSSTAFLDEKIEHKKSKKRSRRSSTKGGGGDLSDRKKHRASTIKATSAVSSGPSSGEATDSSQLSKLRESMSLLVKHTLNPYRKDDCQEGRISCVEDFKHLARKLTHIVVDKELRQLKKGDTSVVTEKTKKRVKHFLQEYMAKFGSVYARLPDIK